jgi:ATP-dependent DNA helicase RecQ
VCTAARFAGPPDPALVEQAWRHLRSKPVEIEVKKMAPDAEGAMRKIPEDVRTEPGIALARIGDGGWWQSIERGLRAGAFDDELVAALAEMIRTHACLQPAWMTWVPSRSLPSALPDLARRAAAALGVDALELVARREPRPPQREMANAAQQAANVRGAFVIVSKPPEGVGVLLDDRRHSGWTLAMVGGQLRRTGAEAVVPVALASLT